MHVAAKIGLSAAGIAIGGAAGAWMAQGLRDRRLEDEAHRREVLETATGEWQRWKSAADAAFPGGRLDTPSDHADFERFLQRTPAPDWVSVEHEDYTRFRVTATSPLDPSDYPVETQKTTGYGVMGGLMAAGLGASGVLAAVRGTRSLLPTAAQGVGGGALVGFGVGMAVGAVLGHDDEAGIDAIHRFVDSINARD